MDERINFNPERGLCVKVTSLCSLASTSGRKVLDARRQSPPGSTRDLAIEQQQLGLFSTKQLSRRGLPVILESVRSLRTTL